MKMSPLVRPVSSDARPAPPSVAPVPAGSAARERLLVNYSMSGGGQDDAGAYVHLVRGHVQKSGKGPVDNAVAAAQRLSAGPSPAMAVLAGRNGAWRIVDVVARKVVWEDIPSHDGYDHREEVTHGPWHPEAEYHGRLPEWWMQGRHIYDTSLKAVVDGEVVSFVQDGAFGPVEYRIVPPDRRR